MMTNTGFYYYRSKDFGKDIDKKPLENFIGNNNLKVAKINDIEYFDYFNMSLQPYFKGKIQSFNLKITYPGLIIGAGYTHPATEEKDFQNGFYFDHTTGMPVIPGSTVKGILKAVFPKPNEKDEVVAEKINYINMKLNKINPGLQIDKNNWEFIFAKGNIFYDAYISGVPSNGKIFAEDYITPHKDIFKNPIPLRFLKIAPGVTFTFQFRLIDAFIGSEKLTADKKKELFKQILKDFGIGAKRNVGYGNLTD